ncbi:MAG: GPR endopeptidase [Clostridia bacterium]|nr:GPR endopeptidase [Clostridia bacterium]
MIFSDLIDEIIYETADFGVLGEITQKGKYGFKRFDISIDSEQKAKKLLKAQGNYTTINISPIIHSLRSARVYLINKLVEVLKEYLAVSKKANPSIFVVGLGNAFLIADSLGARIVKNLLTTHTLPKELKSELGELSALIPGVSGINGIATFDLVKGAVDVVKPDIVIIIDALTAKNHARIGCSFQFSNTSISPGAGVGNKNKILNKTSLGVEVVTIGVPLMINARNFAEFNNLPNLVVTPKEIDIYIETCSKVLSKAINLAVHGKNYKNFV